ncbi:hypothetical protein N5P37_004974 [Trichoderma harzianum]|uniref:Uncharacterized protein n=1 Tax=Trichoderma harzianum CBS 226.95 TaxID=983964 RepID=A0A2T4ADL8_TRIHA|nr:hypothetical protein M431DRAFT_554276 [Trichoderma harzianum CBS 226.95]KAK0762171.1 hypothetical protein N5P37_004974 [Trichoderma harzianum]PTB55103.1 hypothetical protein M431DRAFT_554276 [Trichoderma harzianum CBS 226.95]
MSMEDCKTMVDIIKKGAYKTKKSSVRSPACHPLYRRAIHPTSRHDRPKKLRWPDYVTLVAVYPTQGLHKRYLSIVEEKFRTLELENASDAYYDGHPEDEQEMKEYLEIANNHEDWLRIDPSDDDKKDKENDEEEEDADDNDEEIEDETQKGTLVPSILPQKRKVSNEKDQGHGDQIRLQKLSWMDLTPEDLKDCHNGVVTKNDITITLTTEEELDIYRRGFVSKDTSNESLREQTPRSKSTPQSGTKPDLKGTSYKSSGEKPIIDSKKRSTESRNNTLTKDNAKEATPEVRNASPKRTGAMMQAFAQMAKTDSAVKVPASAKTNATAEKVAQNSSSADQEARIKELERVMKAGQNDHQMIMKCMERLEKNQEMIMKKLDENGKAERDHQSKREESDAGVLWFMKALVESRAEGGREDSAEKE